MSAASSFYDYYSRSLGPEFGGAIGCQFYFLYAIGVTFYLVGFAEEVQHTFFKSSGGGSIQLIASCALAVITIVALLGARAFAKINHYLFALQFGSIFIGVLSMLFRAPMDLHGGGRFTGVSAHTLEDNMNATFTSESNMCGEGQVCDLPSVYGK